MTDIVDDLRRHWQRPRADQGSSSVALKAYEVLYAADRPLSRAELVDGLVSRLDSSEAAYLAAWYQRRKAQERRADTRYRAKRGKPPTEPAILKTDISTITDEWVGKVFDARRKGTTLIRDSDARYRPGPKPPRMLTGDGRLIEFSPEARAADVVAGSVAVQENAQLMEWRRTTTTVLIALAPEDRLLVLAFLARRFAGVTKTHPRAAVSSSEQPPPQRPALVSDNHLRSVLHHLLRAESPIVRRALLQAALDWALPRQL